MYRGWYNFFLESFEQISMYIEYGTPSCVSGGVPWGRGVLGILYIKKALDKRVRRDYEFTSRDSIAEI